MIILIFIDKYIKKIMQDFFQGSVPTKDVFS